jgi:hypothetical protein
VAEFETIQERNISGKGVLRVPSDFAKSRLRILYCSVYRKPKSEYLNLNYSPPKSQYGWLTFSRNGYVVSESLIQYPQQSFDGVADITSQNLIAIKCAYDGILQSFVNLVNGLALTPGSAGLFVTGVTDLIKDYEYLNLAWDEVRVVCYADTALNLKLVALPHDTCDPDKDRPRKPPVPPPPPSTVPPGTPVENLSPPYEDEDNPDNFTEPFEGDTEPPLFGEPCAKYSVPFSLTYFDGVGRVPVDSQAVVFGEIGTFRTSITTPTSWDLLLECRGQAGSPGDVCLAFGEYSIFNGGVDYEDVVVGEPVLIP